ncbi:MAG TPA: carbon monoxide dehydrogenase subunit G [Thermoplasmata archaeon]|nr:carbon monoxide dehydrogenase subunit G [Thermoplasmata archaeon]
MLLEGSFGARAPRERVFTFFLTPSDLSTCIDDAHTIEVQDADHFKGTLKSGVGFIKGTFNWSATVAERKAPEAARIKVHGSGMGSGFDIDATIRMEESGGQTTVAWRAEVAMSGPIASMGARLMQGTIDKKTNAFFENARRKLEGA